MDLQYAIKRLHKHTPRLDVLQHRTALQPSQAPSDQPFCGGFLWQEENTGEDYWMSWYRDEGEDALVYYYVCDERDLWNVYSASYDSIPDADTIGVGKTKQQFMFWFMCFANLTEMKVSDVHIFHEHFPDIPVWVYTTCKARNHGYNLNAVVRHLDL